jgi:hypothetical protein
MSTSKLLQTPEILEVIGSTIRVKHPDISGYTRTELVASIAAGGTTATVSDNNRFADDDWFITGEIGDPKTEEGDVNGAVTRGTSLTITNTNKFAHEISAPMTIILERGVKIYGAATDGGAGTLIASIDAITASANQLADTVMMQWNKDYTEYTLISTDTTYSYYFAKFTDGTTDSSASDYVPASGLAYNSVSVLVDAGLGMANAKIDGEMITREWLLTVLNDWQDEYTNYVDNYGVFKDWSFEVFEDKTSVSATVLENTYAISGFSSDLKYENSHKGILSLKFGNTTLAYKDLDYFEKEYIDGTVRTTSNGGAAIAATSMVLTDSGEFASSGSIYVGDMTITYTTNTLATNTLSGIPASGAGAITSTITSGDAVWQGVSPGVPEIYTIFNSNIILNVPVSDDYEYYKLKIRALKKLTRLTSFSNTVEVSYVHSAKYYIAYRIEDRKGNAEESAKLYQIFRDKLEKDATRDPLQMCEELDYYNFDN